MGADGRVNVFLLIAGFFLPPVAVILMAAPILLPIITTAGFDPIWFAVVLTINMEIGLISPPVGLNLYVINGIAPDISLKTILTGSLPFVACMVLAIILLCLFPGLATWLAGCGDGGGGMSFFAGLCRRFLSGAIAGPCGRRRWPQQRRSGPSLLGSHGEVSGSTWPA